MSTASAPFPAVFPRLPPAINSSNDAGPTPTAIIRSYTIHEPAISSEATGFHLSGTERGTGGEAFCGTGAGAGAGTGGDASRRIAPVTASSAAAVAVVSPDPDEERTSPALRNSAANAAAW